MEVTSPRTWRVDVDGYRTPNNVQLYEQLGGRCYIVVEGAKRKKGHPPPISGYELGEDGTYRKIAPDAHGWLWVDTIGLWIGPYQEWVSWYDADGNKITTNVEEKEGRQREAAARQVAEERVQYEADARQQEADARQRAEERAHRAEEHARAEADARHRAEERIRELEALMRHMRQNPDEG